MTKILCWIFNIGAKPSHLKINDYPPELGPPPPVETPTATEKIKENIEILSETIQKLRSELIAEKKKRQFYEQQYKKVIGEKEKLRKEFYKKKMKLEYFHM